MNYTKKHIILFFILFITLSLNFCTAQNTSKPDCKIYLNFSNYSFEITEGFSQLYDISSRYGILSQECNSFLNFIFTNPVLSNILFPKEIDKCNIYYKEFFNRCRCDSTSRIDIYLPSGKKQEIKIKEFDKDLFDISLLEIRDSALNALNKAFPKYKIKIDVSSTPRMLDEQKKYFRKGASKTLLSTHLIGAAADFKIFFNGRLIDPKKNSRGLFSSIVPYQILGKYIIDKGYFWGITWDPGHMQLKRKLENILIEYPELQNNGNLITSYYNIVKLDSIPLKYKPVIEIMDEKFGINEVRKYDYTQPWVEDTLLQPIEIDKLFKN